VGPRAIRNPIIKIGINCRQLMINLFFCFIYLYKPAAWMIAVIKKLNNDDHYGT
jgi:hypothetical protein